MIIFVSLGIIASIFQLVILREFSFSIAKNELAFTVAAGFWIIFCALGSILKISERLRALPLCILSSLSFTLSICLIHLARPLMGLKYYEATSLGFSLFLGIIAVAPPAFVIGLAFSQFAQEYLKNNPARKNTYAKFFAFEAIGFFLGGITFTFFFIDYSNPLIFSLSALILLPSIKNNPKKILSACLGIAITAAFAINFNAILKKELSNADILANLGSSYGPIIAARKAGATTLFSGGSSLATSEDKSANEDFIHISLSAVEPFEKKDILFIGASIFGQAEEIAKYKPASLDCLQINPLISKLAKDKLPAGLRNKVNFITNDPRLYLKNTNKQYDAVLMLMPAPANLALNRYFTEEFFKIVSKRLKPKGVFSFTIPSKREILSPQFAKFNSSIINAAANVFKNKFLIPSDSMIVLASVEKKIGAENLLNNFSQANAQTDFLTIHALKDRLDPAILDYTQSMLDKNIPANTDLNPSGFLNYLILEQIKFYPGLKINPGKMRPGIIASLLFFAALIIISGRFYKKYSCLLNISVIGFTSISFNSVIFVLFQSYCGALFWKMGLLTAFFMAALSAGAFFLNKIKTSFPGMLAALYFFWIISILILFASLKIIGNNIYTEPAFYFFASLCGFLTGSSYPLLAQNLLKNKFDEKELAPAIYSADLTGSFLGTILSGMLFIPFLGAPHSLLVLIFFNAIFALKNLRG